MGFALVAHAARTKTHRMSDGTVLHFVHHAPLRELTRPGIEWDARKTYRLPVVLVAFSDCGFSQEDPRQFYDRLFNESGFNLRSGPGCVADYFRDQSRGLVNLQFDVQAPFVVTARQKEAGKYGGTFVPDAIGKVLQQLNLVDYDWNGDGRPEIVIVVYAGYGGNEKADKAKDCIWPNTRATTYSVGSDRITSVVSSTAELWSNDNPCGIGTICHEFSHFLGLPDLYPTSGNEFSVLDEWDLMDGGNYADDGWCPPNYSVHELEYVGWLTAEELTEAATINDISPLSNGGGGYRIVSETNSSDYYLLENRQWDGWDLMLPGHGLLVTHVDFKSSDWMNNVVNVTPTHHRLEFMHADGHDYNYYEALLGETSGVYGPDGRSLFLQHTAYPYVDTDGAIHDALPDLMGKSVIDIQETDGLLSFRFSDSPLAITDPTSDIHPVAVFDLQGRRYPSTITQLPPAALYIVRYSDGSTRKICR